MDTNEDVMSLSCDLFRTGKFTDCCELLQRTVDKFHLKQIITRNEVEFILLRNNLLVCNCLVCQYVYMFNLNYHLFKCILDLYYI